MSNKNTLELSNILCDNVAIVVEPEFLPLHVTIDGIPKWKITDLKSCFWKVDGKWQRATYPVTIHVTMAGKEANFQPNYMGEIMDSVQPHFYDGKPTIDLSGELEFFACVRCGASASGVETAAWLMIRTSPDRAVLLCGHCH